MGSSCCVQNLGNQGFTQLIIAIAIRIGEKTWVNNCGINQIRLFMLLIKALQGFIDAFPGSGSQIILVLMDQIKMALQAGIRPGSHRSAEGHHVNESLKKPRSGGRKPPWTDRQSPYIAG